MLHVVVLAPTAPRQILAVLFPFLVLAQSGHRKDFNRAIQFRPASPLAAVRDVDDLADVVLQTRDQTVWEEHCVGIDLHHEIEDPDPPAVHERVPIVYEGLGVEVRVRLLTVDAVLAHPHLALRIEPSLDRHAVDLPDLPALGGDHGVVIASEDAHAPRELQSDQRLLVCAKFHMAPAENPRPRSWRGGRRESGRPCRGRSCGIRAGRRGRDSRGF
mmetsp:Transcript_122892/g.352969  ORF Transcript_122892/g.352969 Transcript_122892/m.352969 type:complete len:216 (+) Transcript_122892:1323-1970(+)